MSAVAASDRVFVPMRGNVERVTLAWFVGIEPEFVRYGVDVVTLVVVWPTGRDGRLRAPEDEPFLALWCPGPSALEAMVRLQRSWPLAEHDLLVDGDRVAPCARTMRQASEYATLKREIRALRRKMGGLT